MLLTVRTEGKRTYRNREEKGVSPLWFDCGLASLLLRGKRSRQSTCALKDADTMNVPWCCLLCDKQQGPWLQAWCVRPLSWGLISLPEYLKQNRCLCLQEDMPTFLVSNCNLTAALSNRLVVSLGFLTTLWTVNSSPIWILHIIILPEETDSCGQSPHSCSPVPCFEHSLPHNPPAHT